MFLWNFQKYKDYHTQEYQDMNMHTIFFGFIGDPHAKKLFASGSEAEGHCLMETPWIM